MIYAICSIGILGFIVWAHLMFVVGLDSDSKSYFTASTMIIAVPTSIKVFSWISTILEGRLRLTVPMYYGIGFIILFTLGGFTGIVLSNASLDIVLHDTYYVIALFLYVLSLGAVSSILGGIYKYSIIIIGKKYNHILGKIQYNLFIIGVNITFFPQLFLGLGGLPRRYSDYTNGYNTYNKLSTYGTYITNISIILLFIIIFLQLTEEKLVYTPNDILIKSFFYNSNNAYNNLLIINGLEYILNIPILFLTFEELPILTTVIYLSNPVTNAETSTYIINYINNYINNNKYLKNFLAKWIPISIFIYINIMGVELKRIKYIFRIRYNKAVDFLKNQYNKVVNFLKNQYNKVVNFLKKK